MPCHRAETPSRRAEITGDDRNATVEMSPVETGLDHWTVTNAQYIFRRSCRPRCTVRKTVSG
jgi:hypothetical protein